MPRPILVFCNTLEQMKLVSEPRHTIPR
jgi:hypothetical protein